MTSPTKILFIGVDAGDKDLILQWAHTGELPTFRFLLEQGAWGTTDNPIGFFVGAIWPSFYTGVSPVRHGRHCFLQMKPGTYEFHRFRPREVKWDPFWVPLSQAGCRVAIIDVPKTYPAEDLNGIHLADWGTHDPDLEQFSSWPPSLAQEIEDQFGREPVGLCDNYGHDVAGLLCLRDALLTRIDKKTKISCHFLDRGRWDLFLAVFSESHCVGHQCWHLHDSTHPRHNEEAARVVGNPIRDVYVAIDRAIGELLARVGPDTIVFVLASHGMGPHYDGTFLLDDILRRLEKAEISATGRTFSEGLSWLQEHTPFLLRNVLRPGWTYIRRKFRQVLPPLGLDTRKCFQIPNNDVYGGIRINLVGREPNGLIRPGPECDAYCETLVRDLLALINLDTGQPLVRRVLRTRDFYGGEGLGCLPDLQVEWNREAPISSVYSRKIGTIHKVFPGRRTGDHKPNGLFFAFGPSIKPGYVKQPVSVMDFAPTIASFLGVPLNNVEGKSRADLLAARTSVSG